jgi:3D (Asp-Asp-Asp) domain-containing protein
MPLDLVLRRATHRKILNARYLAARVPRGAVLTVYDRKYATFVAVSVLSLSFFVTFADSSRAAQRSERPPVSAMLAMHGREHVVRTKAATVGDLLKSQSIVLNPRDEVSPALRKAPRAHETIRIVRVTARTAGIREKNPAPVHHRLDSTLPDGASRTVFVGSPGLRLTTVRVIRRDAARPQRDRLASRILREPRARIVFDGIGRYMALARHVKRRYESKNPSAGRRRRMIATAYTAACDGCSGITVTGVHAGHGIVAVDPRFIPLGTRLYVPGYGRALAADIGGAIQGRRIDLCFDSMPEARRFGRREIVVYVLR